MGLTARLIVGFLTIGFIAGCSCRTAAVDSPRAMYGGLDRSEAAQQGIALSNIYYAFDRYDLTETSRNTLKKNIEWLRANSEVSISIEGHADERGTNEYNMVLAQKRAEAAANYLRSNGIEARRLTTVSFGEERPLDPASNEAAWSKNRRVEFKAAGPALAPIRFE